MATPPSLSLLQALADSPLLGDGGMGTQLIAAGMTTADSAIAWNRDHPDAIAMVHRAYANAGSRILTTNTFQGTRTALSAHGLAEHTATLNTAAAAIARQVADDASKQGGNDLWVAADVGPFGGFLEPLGDTTPEQLTDIFQEQLTALRDGGADVALIETMSDPAEVAVAVGAARQVADWPVITTYAFQHQGGDFTTMMGTTVEQAVAQARDAGAHVVGANCGTGLTLDDYVRLAEQLVAAAGDTPVILQPNAGDPKIHQGQATYDAPPADMARAAKALLDVGVRIVGGCCGTQPAHLAAMAQVF